jgi:hypothetical protein
MMLVRVGMAAIRITAIAIVMLLILAAPAAAQTPDEDGPAGPVIEGADTGAEARAAESVAGDASAHVDGSWTDAAEWPLSAIHAVVLPDGKVMTYGTDRQGLELKAFSYDIWDPSKGLAPSSHTTLPVRTSTNLFCSAQTILPWSGQVLITGGDQYGFPRASQFDGVSDVNLFDPDSQTVTRLADSTARARWYPTVTTLPSGEILVHGGREDRAPVTPVLLPEVYHPTNGWRRLTSAASSAVYGGGRWWYPRSWVAPDGDVFIVTKGRQEMWSLDTDGTGAVRKLGTYPGASTSNATPAVMFDEGKILVTTETGSASVIDINGATPKVTPTDPLGSYRGWSDATVLADGTVLVTGGASVRQNLDKAVNAVELWDPETGRWRRGASASKARLYHSSTVLLPDATVLTAGGGPPGPVVNLNAEIYHPPYLFKKDGSGELASRPSIADHSTVRHGGSFTVDLGGSRTISKVALVRTGSNTHSFDMDQRFMELDFAQSGSRLTVSGPRNANVAPPGQYMLFVIDGNGVPSVASKVRLGPGDPPSSAAVQAGELTLANTDAGRWVTATFKRPFSREPVVTVGGASHNGSEPVLARVRNVTRTSFQVRLDEWAYQDGDHMLETVSYLAAEPGRHTLGGVTVEAGAMTAADDPRTVQFSQAFGKPPVVFAQVAGTNDPTTVTTRVSDVHGGDVRVRLQEQETETRAGRPHGTETVHWIALSRGTGTLAGERLRVGRTGTAVTDDWATIWFKADHPDASLLTVGQSINGTDPAIIRYRNLKQRSAQVRVQEETSYDRETAHTKEKVGFVVIGAK